MGDGARKKRRLVKSRRVAAAREEEEEAEAEATGGGGCEAEEATGGEAEAGSVAQVLSQAIAGGTDAEEEAASSKLEKQFGRLFGGSNSIPVVKEVPRTTAKAAPPTADAAEKPGEPEASTEDANGARKGRFRTHEEKLERETRLVFIGNVPLNWDERMLRGVMKGACKDKYTGPITPIWFRSEPLALKWANNFRDGHIVKDYASGVSDAKNAYAEVKTPEAVPIVCEAVHGLKADDSHILRADGVGVSAKLVTFDRKKSVFVGNLPYDATEAALRKAMSEVGDVYAVRIIRDKTAKACKGYAFVRFTERKSVKAALSLWGVQVQGRYIRVMKVEDQKAEDREKARCAKSDELHPAAKRCLARLQRTQRSNDRKAKEAKAQARKEGRIRTKRPRAERKRKQDGKRVKLKKRRKAK